MALSVPPLSSTLFSKSHAGPLRLVVFGSGGGSNFEMLLRMEAFFTKELGESPFTIVGLFADRRCGCLDLANCYGIPTIYSSFLSFQRDLGGVDSGNRGFREAYDRQTVTQIHERFGEVDGLVLAGYMRLVFDPLLAAFPDRIINVHPADLVALDPEGGRRYVGANAVRDALESGESRTRSSVLLVNSGVDAGEVLVSGPWVGFEGGDHGEHQERQKLESDWPALAAAVLYLAEGRLGLSASRSVCLDGQALGPGGLDLSEGPSGTENERLSRWLSYTGVGNVRDLSSAQSGASCW